MISSISTLVNVLGGPTKLAKKLGCTPQNICLWDLRKEIPVGWHYRLHLLTEAKGEVIDRTKLFGVPKGWEKF